MTVLLPFLALVLAAGIAAYHRLTLPLFTALAAGVLVLCGLAGANLTATIVAGVLLAIVVLPLLLTPIRQRYITAPLLSFYTKILPPLSDTEKVALEAGTVGFEGELFSGRPDWERAAEPAAPGTDRRGAGLPRRPGRGGLPHDQRRETTHDRADLAPEVWDYVKKHKFFGMIIAKEYGGLGFSAYAHSPRDPEAGLPFPPRSAPRSACRTRSARASCLRTTAPRSRRSTTCRAWPTAARYPASA